MTSKGFGKIENSLENPMDDTLPVSAPPPQNNLFYGERLSTTGQTEDAVRQRAHEIWSRAGSPDGVHDEHWAQARTELDREDAG